VAIHAFDGFSIDKTPAEGLDDVFANAPTPDMYVMEVVPTPLSDEELEGLVEKPLSAVKLDGGKIRLDLVPYDALDEIAKALAFGAAKYSEGNWEGGFEWRRLIGATLRHVTSWARGQDKDPESGVSHLAHAGAMILFLLSHELRGIGKDNRFKY
jgi:hypothetical protein